ncbi:extracellular solute-binding protein [Zhihengliuella flava]|uniref:Multiple sugar transport system substrate-binding protein n=1 Tax=Zhihengliuella flava TaxID=1285193 RepID=A0A931D9U4_9MICC|nr:extracellular solute-binding protein [Zhihengliuella flava]MBG6084999.1 multiple sugar transport system substrate-binding protein [Zhihengliuella flava]
MLTTHINRRRFLSAAAALAGAGMLGGCAATPATDERTLQFWHLLSGGDGVTMAGLIDQVNAAHSGFEAKQTVLAWGAPYYTKLAMAGAGGRAPEVAIMHASRVPGYVPGGLLDPWDKDLLASYGVGEAQYSTPVWDKSHLGGELYSVALDAHPFIMLYNKELCAEAGVLDGNGRLQQATSPDEFLALGRELSGVSEGHGISYGYLGGGSQMWRLFYTLYCQQGATMELPQGGPAQIDEDAAVTALRFMQQLLDGEIAAAQNDEDNAIAEFATGQSAILFTGVWELPTMQEQGIDVGAATLPTIYSQPAVYADSHSFVLPRQLDPDPELREMTYAFVADLLTRSTEWAAAGHIPAYLPVTESEEYAQLEPQADYADAANHLVYDPPAWFTGSGSNFQNNFGQAVQGALMTGSDPTPAVQAVKRDLDAILAKPNPTDPEGEWSA